MSDWIKCSERLPYKSDEHCWIYLTDGTVVEAWYTADAYIKEWNQSKLEFDVTIESSWRLDEDCCDWAWLDTVTHWMPYFTPEPPNE